MLYTMRRQNEFVYTRIFKEYPKRIFRDLGLPKKCVLREEPLFVATAYGPRVNKQHEDILFLEFFGSDKLRKSDGTTYYQPWVTYFETQIICTKVRKHIFNGKQKKLN